VDDSSDSVDRHQIKAEDQYRTRGNRTNLLISIPKARRDDDSPNPAHFHASYTFIEAGN
jgi:hypothetical protein